MKLKGVSLSIETIIVIVICALVLITILLFFSGTFTPTAKGVTSEAQLDSECMDWQGHGYSYKDFSENVDKYPGLLANYKGAITAKRRCVRDINPINLIRCGEGNCTETPFTSTSPCCCINTSGTCGGECSYYNSLTCP